jgi:hypothetical protein
MTMKLGENIRKTLEDQLLRFYSSTLSQEFSSVEAFKSYSDDEIIAFSLAVILSDIADKKGLSGVT